MRWYQPFECDNAVENPLVCGYSNLAENGYDKWIFLEGRKIVDWKSNIVFQAKEPEDDGDPDDALQNAEMLPIYSPRLIRALHDSEVQGIQFLAVNVLRPNNALIPGFCIANLLNFTEAFDHENSKYARTPDNFPNPDAKGKIAGVMKFVLKKEKIEGLDILRLKEYEMRFFVSAKFKKIFEKNKFMGYSFREVELT